MRLLARARAKVGGYFWLPCPACGREFGGHERPNGRFITGPGRAMSTCPRCTGTYRDLHGSVVQLGADVDDSGRTVPLWHIRSS